MTAAERGAILQQENNSTSNSDDIETSTIEWQPTTTTNSQRASFKKSTQKENKITSNRRQKDGSIFGWVRGKIQGLRGGNNNNLEFMSKRI